MDNCIVVIDSKSLSALTTFSIESNRNNFFSLNICENGLYSVRYENILNFPHADEGLSRVWHCYITVLVSASIETHRSA